MENFINFEKFKTLFYKKRGKSKIAESTYLKFKHDIKSVYGPIDTQKKYPPPIPNKNFKPGNFQNTAELMKKT